MTETSSQIRRSDDQQGLFVEVANDLVQAATASISARGRFELALSGGSTPAGLYRLLVSDAYRARIDWKSVHFYWGDERSVPSDHADSNYRMAHRTLLQPLGIEKRQVHRIRTEIGDWDQVALDYQQQIASAFPRHDSDSPPQLDVILLGMGDDGHTASLFPHTTALAEVQKWVVANAVPQLATTRITMTVPMLNAGRQVWFMVAGRDKSAALQEVLRGKSDPQRWPSQLIQPARGQLRWYVDRAAARALTD